MAAMVAAAGLAGMAAAGPVLPDFSPAEFVAGGPIDNPYFPLVPGTRYRYQARITDPETGETIDELSENLVTFNTEVVGGARARVVHARTWEDDILTEDTDDWFAQDKSGNVWYLGEATTALEYDDDGNLTGTSHAGSWRAGVDGARPGYIMPADPQVGFNHYQEFAEAADALGQAEILARGGSVSVPAGDFSGLLKIREFSESEPGIVENKYYAPGVGLVFIEENLDAAGRPLNTISLQSVTVVPLPPAMWAAVTAWAVFLLSRIRRGARSVTCSQG